MSSGIAWKPLGSRSAVTSPSPATTYSSRGAQPHETSGSAAESASMKCPHSSRTRMRPKFSECRYIGIMLRTTPVKTSFWYGLLAMRCSSTVLKVFARMCPFGSGSVTGMIGRQGASACISSTCPSGRHCCCCSCENGSGRQGTPSCRPGTTAESALWGARCSQELLPGDAAGARELVFCVLCSSGRLGEHLLKARRAWSAHS